MNEWISEASSSPHILWICLRILFTLIWLTNPLAGFSLHNHPPWRFFTPMPLICGSPPRSVFWNMLNTRQKNSGGAVGKRQHFVPLDIQIKYKKHSPEEKSDKAFIYQRINGNNAFSSSDKYRPERTYWNGMFTGLGMANQLCSGRIYSRVRRGVGSAITPASSAVHYLPLHNWFTPHLLHQSKEKHGSEFSWDYHGA